MTGRTILILHYTPPGIIGGAEHIIQQHVSLLTERGYDVHVVAGRDAPAGGVHVIPEMNVAASESIAVEKELASGVVSNRFHQHRQVIREGLEPLLGEAASVIVHNAFTLHFSLPLTAALWELSARRTVGSVIAWCHDLAWVNPLYIPTLHPGYPWELLRVPAPGVRYVTISHERRAELLGLWGNRDEFISVVPNGVDVCSFLRISPLVREIVERYRLFERDAVLVLPVRITRRKNIELGIRAVRALRDLGYDVCFLVSGPQAPHHPGRSGEYLAELMELRKALKLEDEVVFLANELGHNLDVGTISELYAVSDILLFPSASEGFGLPILEAGLARIPAVVSDIPVLGEVGGEDVWTFDPLAEADRIAGEIVSALNTRTARLYRRTLREYRWDVIVERHILPLLAHEA